jgi:hypothetical protein
MAGFCEHGNEPSGSIKGVEFLDYLSDYQLLKKGSAPCREGQQMLAEFTSQTKILKIRRTPSFG